MKKIITLLGVLIFISCEKEIINESNLENNNFTAINSQVDKKYNEFLKKNISNVFFKDYIEIKEKNENYIYNRCGSNSVLINCSNDFDFGQSYKPKWYILNNNYGFLDFHLENDYNANYRFNLRLIKASPPVIVGNGEVLFADSPDPFGNYTYLTDPNLSFQNYDIVRQELACRLKDFMDNTGFYVFDIDVMGDALLCNGNATRYVRVLFNYGY